MDESYTQRFGGIGRLYGAAALSRLASAHVAIVGVGGVGSWVVEALARSGVGELTLIDMDDVCITNTNRQLPAMAHTLGHAKVDVLATRVAEINPGCRVHRVVEFLLESNVDRLLAPQFDFVVDAIDRTSIKALILAKCRARGLPVITSGSAGGGATPPPSASRTSVRRAPIRFCEARGRASAATTASPCRQKGSPWRWAFPVCTPPKSPFIPGRMARAPCSLKQVRKPACGWTAPPVLARPPM